MIGENARVRVVSWQVDAGAIAPELVFRRLVCRARQRGLPGPAALVGTWFGGRAVLAPSVAPAAADGPPVSPPDISAAPGVVGGGWFGYLGYGLTDPGEWTRRLPPAAWGWADHVLRCDADGGWWFEALVPDDADDPVALGAELAGLVASGADPPRSAWRAGHLRTPDPAGHRAAVAACREYIAAGEIYQANICTRFEADFAGDPAGLFATGLLSLHANRSAYLEGDWGAVVSFSPELFLARHGTDVRSTPIKGTLPRRGPADNGNDRRLRRSDKDVAENVMIVDLVRNDLGRVATAGSVRVPELLAVRPAPGVWHLESTVGATLPAGMNDRALLTATFPPGSVTGAPKLRALEVIAALESAPREVYCGAVGLLSPVAGCELNVAIRTFEIADGRLWLGVGGGITTGSDPTAEWHEVLHKAAPLRDLLVNGVVDD